MKTLSSPFEVELGFLVGLGIESRAELVSMEAEDDPTLLVPPSNPTLRKHRIARLIMMGFVRHDPLQQLSQPHVSEPMVSQATLLADVRTE